MRKNKFIKGIKNKVEQIGLSIKNFFIHLVLKMKRLMKEFKKDPKKFIKKRYKRFKKACVRNKDFVAFVAVSVLNSTILRFVTVHNYFAIKPFLADLSVVLFIGAFGFLIKPKRRNAYFIGFNIFLTLICFINSIYYTFYSSFSSVSLLATSRFVVDVGDSVTENVFQVKDLIYWIGPIFLIWYYRHLKKKHFVKSDASKKKFVHSIVAALVCLFFFVITLTSLEIGRFAKQWNREYIVTKFGLYTYHINDLVQSIKPQLSSLFGYDKAMKEFKAYYEEHDTSHEENKYTDIFEGKNVIVIHAESLQNFVIGLKINGQEVAPNFTKLAKEGLYFDNFYTQVSVGTSSDSEFTFNTSLMPSYNGTVFVSYFDREYVSTPKLLKEKGYYTFSMHANTGDFWNRNVMHQNLGYDRFYSKDDYEVLDEDIVGLGLSDESFFAQSVDYIKEIKEKNQPFLGTLITLSNHTPFSDTDKYGDFKVSLIEKDESGNEVEYPYLEGTKLGNYLKSVHYADKAFGEFVEKMKQEGLWENTVLVVYGDHDARLPKNDFVRMYNYDKENDDILPEDDENYVEFGNYQYELNRKTPFIIWTQDQEVSGTIHNVMGMYDVQPTLGNMFGFSNPYALGHDIFDIKDNNIVVFPNSDWVTNKVYYNAQKGEYLALTQEPISEDYIEQCNTYASSLLDVSNDIVVYDLIRKEREASESYTEEVSE